MMASSIWRITLVTALVAGLAYPAGAATFQGKVVGVTSGDSITVLRGKARVTVLLYGVDAPAVATPLGAAARRFAHGLVMGQVVTVKPVGKARPGGIVAGVSVARTESTDLMEDGSHRAVRITRFLGEELINAGLARWDRKEAPKAKRLALLEATARKARRGVWGKPLQNKPAKGGCYKRCLDQSRTQAISWSAIKAQCRRRCPLKTPPVRPRSKDRACKRNKDCVVAWDPCSYRNPPCEDSWKSAVNRAADLRHRSNWANKKPACNKMNFCRAGQKSGRWLGTRAACVGGQCVIRP